LSVSVAPGTAVVSVFGRRSVRLSSGGEEGPSACQVWIPDGKDRDRHTQCIRNDVCACHCDRGQLPVPEGRSADHGMGKAGSPESNPWLLIIEENFVCGCCRGWAMRATRCDLRSPIVRLNFGAVNCSRQFIQDFRVLLAIVGQAQSDRK
jgi:hypothetical protein